MPRLKADREAVAEGECEDWVRDGPASGVKGLQGYGLARLYSGYYVRHAFKGWGALGSDST